MASSATRQGVIPATVLSHTLATTLSLGSLDQPYTRLDFGGGVRADAASERTNLNPTLHLAANASTAITAAFDVPVLKFRADQVTKLQGGGAIVSPDLSLHAGSPPTNQVGTTQVGTDYEWYTYTLNLLQDAFYNPQSR